MTRLQLKKRKRFLKGPARRSLLTAAEMEKDVLEMTDVAASMDLSEEIKQGMEVLSEAKNPVWYIYIPRRLSRP